MNESKPNTEERWRIDHLREPTDIYPKAASGEKLQPVPLAIHILTSAIENLESITERTASKLSPILAPYATTAGSGTTLPDSPTREACNLVEQIDELEARLSKCSRNLEQLLNRVEL